MKLIFLGLLIFCLNIVTVAQDQGRPVNPQDQITDEHPQPRAFTVQPEDMPHQVRTSLASEDYEGWNTLGTYLVREEDGEVFYAIEMEKDGERKTVTLDRAGQEVDKDLREVFEEYETGN